MRKPEPTITVKQHLAEIAKKDVIIAELADIVSEFENRLQDLVKDYVPIAERAKKAINKKAVKDVAWPRRTIGR